MVKANFYSEDHLTEHASRGGQAKQEARRQGEHIDAVPLNIPYWQRCGYADFCRWLVQKHGADYLRGSDGQSLNGVPDSAFVVPPTKAPKPVNPRQLPPDVYTGNAASDLRLEQKPHPQEAVIKRRQPGSLLRQMVLGAVRQRPMLLAEICVATGLPNQAVKNVLFRYRGTYFRNDNHYWSEVQNTMEVL